MPGGKFSKDKSYHSDLAQQFYKTKLCPLFSQGQCQKGTSCNYAHSDVELNSLPDFKKTKFCRNFKQGNCTRGDQCNFAHCQEELNTTTVNLSIENMGKSRNFSKDGYKGNDICKYYEKGQCRNGSNCTYSHSRRDQNRNYGSQSNNYKQLEFVNNPVITYKQPVQMQIIPN